MKNSFLHIGPGKVSSTVLQNKIFPYICRLNNLKFIKNHQVFRYFGPPDLNNPINDLLLAKKKKKLPRRFFISKRGLLGRRCCPSTYEMSVKNNLRLFGKKLNIILIIRKPSDYLNSVYNQVLQDGNIMSEFEFFFDRKQFKQNNGFTIYKTRAFLLEDYDFKKLINIYRRFFVNVIVIKYDALQDFSNFQNIFNLSKNDIKKLNYMYKNYKSNVSYSYYTIKLLFFIKKIFSVSYHYNPQRLKKVKNLNRNIFIKIYNLFRIIFSFNDVFKKINSFLPKKKFKINFKKFKYINIFKLDKEYNNFPNIKIYKSR